MKFLLILVLSTVGSAVVFTPTASAAEEAARPTATEVRSLYTSGALFVDVRTDQEWDAGHLTTALHLPVSQVADQAPTLLPDKKKPIVTYCGSGPRALKAAETLRALGYSHVTAMSGGFKDIKAAGYLVTP